MTFLVGITVVGFILLSFEAWRYLSLTSLIGNAFDLNELFRLFGTVGRDTGLIMSLNIFSAYLCILLLAILSILEGLYNWVSWLISILLNSTCDFDFLSLLICMLTLLSSSGGSSLWSKESRSMIISTRGGECKALLPVITLRPGVLLLSFLLSMLCLGWGSESLSSKRTAIFCAA